MSHSRDRSSVLLKSNETMVQKSSNNHFSQRQFSINIHHIISLTKKMRLDSSKASSVIFYTNTHSLMD